MRKLTLLLIIFSSVMIISCAPRQLNPEARNVKITASSSTVSNNCKFLGNITLESIHGDMSLTASQSDRKLDDINFLKNEGKKLGANVVTVLQHNSRLVERERIGALKPFIRVSTTYDIEAKAYACPVGFEFSDINSNVFFAHESAVKK